MNTQITVPGSIASRRKDFPQLKREVNGQPLVYLDNAATTQKPQSVIDSINDYYSNYNANIHRGVHFLANLATDAFEGTREKVRSLLHAKESNEIIFTSGTTDAINLVAQTWGRQHLQAGDEVLLSMMEHHSNIVPWQMIAGEKGAIIKVIPVTARGEWDLSALPGLVSPRTKIVAVNHVSNALGTINPVKELIDLAHRNGAVVVLDGAQAVAHFDVNVQELDCDFYCFSAHKLFGPTGTGVLFGKKELLEDMPPYRGGGEMIRTVSFEGTTYGDVPHKFEAGTPNIEGVIALGAALDYFNGLDKEQVMQHESELLRHTTESLSSIKGIRIFGTSPAKVPVISFLVDGIHPYDLGTLLDQQGIAVRTGHHCTQPLWDFYGVPGSVRVSFSFYNTIEECDRFIAALQMAVKMLGGKA